VDTLAGHNTNQSYFTYTTRCIVPSGATWIQLWAWLLGVTLGVAVTVRGRVANAIIFTDPLKSTGRSPSCLCEFDISFTTTALCTPSHLSLTWLDSMTTC